MSENNSNQLTKKDWMVLVSVGLIGLIIALGVGLPLITAFFNQPEPSPIYYYETVVVEEITTEIRVSNPLVIHLFKGNSSITDEWIMAKYNSGFMSRRYFAIQIGDFVEVKWRIRSIGYVFLSSEKLEV